MMVHQLENAPKNVTKLEEEKILRKCIERIKCVGRKQRTNEHKPEEELS